MSLKQPFPRIFEKPPHPMVHADKEAWQKWLDQQQSLAFATDVFDGPKSPPQPDRKPMPVNKEADE